MKKRMIALLLVLVMVLGVLPAQVFAEEETAEIPVEIVTEELPEETQPAEIPIEAPEELAEEVLASVGEEIDTLQQENPDVQLPEVGTYKTSWSNPWYEDLADPEYDEPEEIPIMPRTFLSLDEAAIVLRDKMIARKKTVVVQAYYINETSLTEEEFEIYVNALWEAVLLMALVHDGTPNGGDYLYWHLKSADGEIGYDRSDPGALWMELTYKLTYTTTASQESSVTSRVNSALKDIIKEDMTDYQKVVAIYDYIIDRVAYDEAAVNNPNDILAHTAYGAIYQKSAVCDGYAILFYRMCLEAGIDALMITGLADGDGDGVIDGAHAWNVVRLDGVYYNVDVTWDDALVTAGQDYGYFLKCNETFEEDHIRDYGFTDANYNEDLPMATWDFPDGCIAFGKCGDNAYWKLTEDNTLTFYGSGAIYDKNSDTKKWFLSKNAEHRVEKVVVSEGITIIGNSLCSGYSSLTDVQLPTTLQTIGERAFSKCTSLNSIVIPEGVTTLEYAAFQGCNNLESVTIPTTLRTVEEYAFKNSGIKNVYISDIAAWANINFEYGLRGETRTKSNPLYSGADLFFNGVLVTDLVDYKEITKINKYSFSGYKNFVELTLPDSVKIVDEGAFADCKNLKIVNLNNVNDVGVYAFHGCDSLASVSAQNVEIIRSNAFQNCSALESVNQLDVLVTLDDVVFDGCASLKNIDLPETLTELGNYVFRNCTSLKSVTLENVTNVGQGVFYNCTGLEEANLGDKLTELGYKMFYNCTSLKEINIPASVVEQETYVFEGCTSLKIVRFYGNAPRGIYYEDKTMFKGVTATAYYPANNSTWTSKTLHNYGGNITWVAMCDHDYEAIVMPPTCTEKGYTTYTCVYCGESYVDTYVDVIEHSYESVVTLPTCTEAGYTTYTCTYCGDSYVDTPVDATGHNFTDWTEVDGMTLRTCQVEGCGCVEYESGAKNLTTGKFYSDIVLALAEASPGDTVEMLASNDITGTTLVIPAGVTLDLKAYTLTADYLVGLKGSMLTGTAIDKNGENGGKLMVPQKGILLSSTAPDGTTAGYKILPVWNGECFIFSQAAILKTDFQVGKDSVRLDFIPNFTGYVKNNLFKTDGCADNDVSVIIAVSWMESGIRVTQEYFYTTSLIIDAMNNKLLFAEMVGCDAKEDLVFRIAIKTDCGVEITSQNYLYGA